MRRYAKWLAMGLAALVLINLAYLALRPRTDGDPVELSVTLDLIDSRQITRATLFPSRVVVVLADGRKLSSDFPGTYIDDLVALLHQRRIPFEVGDSVAPGILPLFVILPFVLFGLFWRWLARRLPPPGSPSA